jgi:2-C-methyl-D-erythritol 2,4-cyclodiphosphate synthase
MNAPFRIGHGYDLHRLQGGGQLVLGGVAVSADISPISHSDGDVVMHALVDAILGAMGKGDIGEHFPDTDDRWANAASRVFLEHAVSLARSAGYRVINADVTILAERPRLKAYKGQIVANLEQLLGGPANVKAGTNEKCDAIGQGEAIAAHAVVLLGRDGAAS